MEQEALQLSLWQVLFRGKARRQADQAENDQDRQRLDEQS